MTEGAAHLAVSLLGTRMRVVHESHCPEIGPICSERDEPAHLHDLRLNILQVLISGEYAFTERWGVGLRLPLKRVNTEFEYRTLDGAPFEPGYPSIHHRDETLAGVVDPWLMGRLSFEVGGTSVIARAGLSLPLGHVEPDPFAAGERGEVHQHLQFGSGTLRPVAVLEAQRGFGPVTLAAYGQAQLALYENRYGYLPGHNFGAGLGTTWHALERLGLTASADVLIERPERWHGAVKEDGNLGRTDVLLGASAAYSFDRFDLALSFRTPVWQHVIRGQLTYPALLELSASSRF